MKDPHLRRIVSLQDLIASLTLKDLTFTSGENPDRRCSQFSLSHHTDFGGASVFNSFACQGFTIHPGCFSFRLTAPTLEPFVMLVSAETIPVG